VKFYFVFDFAWLYDVGVFADGIAGISLPAISMKPSSRKQVLLFSRSHPFVFHFVDTDACSYTLLAFMVLSLLRLLMRIDLNQKLGLKLQLSADNC
jgi:hypothetical protein